MDDLSIAIIKLYEDTVSASLPNHSQQEQFVSFFPVYHSLLQDSSAEKKGWLSLDGISRWFVLDKGTLSWYKSPQVQHLVYPLPKQKKKIGHPTH